MSDDNGGFWSSLGTGLQNAGAILSPQVYQSQQQERMLALQQQNRQRELMATSIINGIQAGSVDAAAGRAALQRLGFGQSAGVIGPSQEAQANQQFLQAANGQAGGASPSGAPGMVPGGLGGAISSNPALASSPMAQNWLKSQKELRDLQKPLTPPIVKDLPTADGKSEIASISLDGGQTWKPVQGAVARPIFKPDNPSSEKTPFMKENERYQQLVAEGKGKSAEAIAIKKHLDKMDAPTSVMVNAGRQALDPDTRAYMAQQYLTGDKSVLTGLARNPIEMGMMRQEIVKQAKAKGMSPADVSASIAEFAGLTAGERTAGTRSANVEMAVAEAQNMIPLALKASADLKRTNIKSVNELLQFAQGKTSSPELRRLAGATNSLVNIYARAVSPSGVPAISDKDHAREVLDKAFSDGDYKAAVDQLQQEMGAAQASPGQVIKGMRERFTGTGNNTKASNSDPLGIR